MAGVIDVYFRDLSEGKQREALEAYGIEKPEDMNWDIFWIASIPIPEPEGDRKLNRNGVP